MKTNSIKSTIIAALVLSAVSLYASDQETVTYDQVSLLTAAQLASADLLLIGDFRVKAVGKNRCVLRPVAPEGTTPTSNVRVILSQSSDSINHEGESVSIDVSSAFKIKSIETMKDGDGLNVYVERKG